MRIKKVSQTTATQAQVVDGRSTSTTDSYSCNYVNKISDYSTTEQVVGTWLGEPLYRVVVETTTPNALSTWKEIYTGHNVNKIIKYGGYYSVFALPLNTNDRNFWFSVSSSNNIQMAIDASSDTNKSITLWFEYTKTTN